MDIVHKIIVDMGMSGALAPGQLESMDRRMQSIQKSTSGVSDMLRDAGRAMADTFTGAVEKVGSIAMGLGQIAVGGGIAAATYGVIKLNKELESTTIALGTIFSANGLSNGMNDGMAAAGSIMKQIRADAKALPGETEDLLGIFRQMAIPGSRALGEMGVGGNAAIQRMEKLSANVMAAGAVANLSQDMVAREAAMLIAGRAGAHNVLGSTLFGLTGEKAEGFNKSSAGERFKFLEEGMKKYGASIEYFNDTYEAQASTLADNAKMMVMAATKPLFDHVKGTLAHINGWITDNQALITAWTGYIGDHLARAWDMGIDKIQEWWPAIQKFASDAYGELVGAWERIGPTVKSVAMAIKDALSNGEALDKIEKILMLYAATKIGMPMLSAGSSIVGGLGSLGGGAGAAGALTVGGVAAAAPAVIALGIAALAAGGELSALTDASSQYHDQAVKAASDLETAYSHLSMSFDMSLRPALEKFGVTVVEYTAQFSDLAYKLGSLNGKQIQGFIDMMDKSGQTDFGDRLLGANRRLSADEDVKVDRSNYEVGNTLHMMNGLIQQQDQEKKNTTKPVTGGGGTSIQKVEIVVSSNADPSRVARLVYNELVNLGRNPRSSPDVPNYSSSHP